MNGVSGTYKGTVRNIVSLKNIFLNERLIIEYGGRIQVEHH